MDKRGKIIAISSFKGGVGKTITTLNLAGIYSNLHKKVLVVDLDLETGSVSLNLNLDNSKTIYNVMDDIANNRFKDHTDYVVKYNDNIDIVNSLKDPRQSRLIDSKYIEMFLNFVQDKYDVILLDTRHGFNSITLTAMDMAYNTLFILTNDIMDIKSCKTFLNILKDIEKTNYKILLNESIRPHDKFYTKFEIENIIKDDIDYTFGSSMYINNITKWINDGDILTLNKKIEFKNKKDLKNIKEVCIDLIK